jgi:hypothetical protein
MIPRLAVSAAPLLVFVVCHVAKCQPISVTFSLQQSPTPLPKGLGLYAIEVCGSGVRAVSGSQVFDAGASVGVHYQAPSLYAGLLAHSENRTVSSKLLTFTKYASTGMSIGSGIETYLKTQSAVVTNTATWAKITVATGALAAGLTIAQPFAQANVNAQQAIITAGVQGALMTDSDLYSVANGCAQNPHRMMYAIGSSTGKGMIP